MKERKPSKPKETNALFADLDKETRTEKLPPEEYILRILEEHDGLCLDNPQERKAVAKIIASYFDEGEWEINGVRYLLFRSVKDLENGL